MDTVGLVAGLILVEEIIHRQVRLIGLLGDLLGLGGGIQRRLLGVPGGQRLPQEILLPGKPLRQRAYLVLQRLGKVRHGRFSRRAAGVHPVQVQYLQHFAGQLRLSRGGDHSLCRRLAVRRGIARPLLILPALRGRGGVGGRAQRLRPGRPGVAGGGGQRGRQQQPGQHQGQHGDQAQQRRYDAQVAPSLMSEPFRCDHLIQSGPQLTPRPRIPPGTCPCPSLPWTPWCPHSGSAKAHMRCW